MVAVGCQQDIKESGVGGAYLAVAKPQRKSLGRTAFDIMLLVQIDLCKCSKERELERERRNKKQQQWENTRYKNALTLAGLLKG